MSTSSSNGVRTPTLALDRDLAIRLCREVQEHQPIKIFTQCWGCVKFSKGDPQKMCGEIVACNLVLSRYHRLEQKGEM